MSRLEKYSLMLDEILEADLPGFDKSFVENVAMKFDKYHTLSDAQKRAIENIHNTWISGNRKKKDIDVNAILKAQNR